MEVLDSSDPPGELPSDARFATPALVQCKTEASQSIVQQRLVLLTTLPAPLQPLPEPRQQTVAVKREQIPNSSSGGSKCIRPVTSDRPDASEQTIYHLTLT